MNTLRRLHLLLRSNWITSSGAALMTLAVLAFVSILVMQSTGQWQGPYMGLVTLIVLPATFLFGMLLVPFGLLVYRRQLHARMQTLADKPLYFARAVVALTLINLAGLGTVGALGVGYMDSVEFCGTACHSVMEPEYVTYLDSAHCRVACVDCHIGAGAESFLRAKLNGVNQLVHYLRDDHSRPVPTPVKDLAPAAETCERCHWSEKYLGTKLIVKPRFRTDEEVSAATHVLLMRTGGTRADGESVGIHWHVHPEAVVEYVATDAQRTEIPWVRVRQPGKPDRVFVRQGSDRAQPSGALRRMDCNDCHNRAAHSFDDPSEAIDRAIAAGLISRELPFVKKHALELLNIDATREAAPAAIRRGLLQRYAGAGALDQATLDRVDRTADALVAIWQRNVYPHLKLGWNTHRDLRSHHGCFRCHDGEHRDEQGREITHNCDACHVVLSEDERDPAILETLGLRGNR
jgi:hypothetical protein